MGNNRFKAGLQRVVDKFYPIFPEEDCSLKRKNSDVCLLVIAICTIAAASFVFLYTDLTDMVCNSMLLIRAVFEGRLKDFYTFSLENAWSSFAVNYDLPIYLIFSVWDLPMALIFHCEPNGIIYLWDKLLIIICILVCACQMYKIYMLYDEEHFSRGAFFLLLINSPLVFLAEFAAGQYDCISMMLILAGLYEYIKGRDKRAVLLFCLAIPIKTFAVFLFIPLLVYREKNLLKILLKTACVFSIPILFKLIFRGDPAYSILLGAQNQDAAELLTNASIQIFNIDIHVFILVFMSICFFCYFSRYDRSKVLLIAAAIYTSFIVFIPIRSYWIFLAEPFLILLVATRPRYYKVNILLHTAAQISGSIFFLYFHTIYNSNWIARGLGLNQILDMPKVVRYGNFNNFINIHGWGSYMPLLRTVFFGSCILLIAVNCCDWRKLELSSHLSARFLLWMRQAVILGIFGIMVFVELYPCSLPLIDTLDYSISKTRLYIDYEADAAEAEALSEGQTETEIEVLTGEITDKSAKVLSGTYYSADLNAGTVIEQAFEVMAGRTVSQISFQCKNYGMTRWNRGRLHIEIVNDDTNEVLAETIEGSALIETGNICIADVEKTYLDQGKYKIRFSCVETPESRSIYMMCNEEAQGAEPAVVDGVKMEYPVCVCVN